MASTRKRLADLTADLKLPDEVPAAKERAVLPAVGSELPPVAAPRPLETRFPQARTGPGMPRTGPGQMLAFRGQMLEVEGELTSLREKLSRFEDSMPSKRLSPQKVRPSRWANRHEESFNAPAFVSFKDEISKAGGNVQPILVRPVADVEGEFEIVFGHRRHRACLELGIPVLAMIWEDGLNDLELFTAMDRENRERADLSPFEQGQMYQRALDEGLFPSQRQLAEQLGVSHTWVRKALMVAQLPPAVVECFRSPLEISHRHGEKLTAALDADRRLVLKRAEKLRGQGSSASQVVDRLLDVAKTAQKDVRLELRSEGRKLGYASRDASGAIKLDLLPGALLPSAREALFAAIGRTLDELSESDLTSSSSEK